jgi:hypothetical protein
MRLRMIGFALAGLLAWTAAPSHAAIVTFTGGTVTRLDTSTETTTTTANWDNVDYYEEDGFRLDFLPNTATLFSTNVGDYYGAGNDVIHSHWATGNFGTVTSIEITKVGGGPASGNERAFIQGFDSLNNPTGLPQLLPVENWGFPATQIFLGAAFDAVERVVFTVENSVDCFGMDEFYIDEQAPGVVPEPASVAVWSLLGVVVGLGVYRRRGRNA